MLNPSVPPSAPPPSATPPPPSAAPPSAPPSSAPRPPAAGPGDPAASPAELEARLAACLDEPALAWLRQACAEAAAAPAAARWELHFASAGRAVGRPAAVAARVLLLCAARADAATATRLYERGTSGERQAVLTALPYLDLGPAAVPLVQDALRANDTGLVAAAVGPYATAHLDPHGWRHAVLKCLFTGVPLSAVHGLALRARGDAELARMLTDYARERSAAGRPVPADLHRALELTHEPAPEEN